MSKYKSPKLPYVEARCQFGKQRPKFFVLRGSFTTSTKGAALGVAQNWHSAPEPWWAGHYSVDEELIFRCVPDRAIAGTKEAHDKGAIRIAICAEPVSRDIFWSETLHAPVLHKVAGLIADLSLVYRIPIRYIENDRRHKGGIVLDTPSGWPRDIFLNEVQAQRALKTHI